MDAQRAKAEADLASERAFAERVTIEDDISGDPKEFISSGATVTIRNANTRLRHVVAAVLTHVVASPRAPLQPPQPATRAACERAAGLIIHQAPQPRLPREHPLDHAELHRPLRIALDRRHHRQPLQGGHRVQLVHQPRHRPRPHHPRPAGRHLIRQLQPLPHIPAQAEQLARQRVHHIPLPRQRPVRPGPLHPRPARLRPHHARPRRPARGQLIHHHQRTPRRPAHRAQCSGSPPCHSTVGMIGSDRWLPLHALRKPLIDRIRMQLTRTQKHPPHRTRTGITRPHTPDPTPGPPPWPPRPMEPGHPTNTGQDQNHSDKTEARYSRTAGTPGPDSGRTFRLTGNWSSTRTHGMQAALSLQSSAKQGLVHRGKWSSPHRKRYRQQLSPASEDRDGEAADRGRGGVVLVVRGVRTVHGRTATCCPARWSSLFEINEHAVIRSDLCTKVQIKEAVNGEES
jgi:hypothetical protein